MSPKDDPGATIHHLNYASLNFQLNLSLYAQRELFTRQKKVLQPAYWQTSFLDDIMLNSNYLY